MTGNKTGISSDALDQAAGDEPLFSVVIPAFNRVDLLEQTLNSVFAQRFTSYELIVVDDGSTDSTVDFLRSLEPRLTFLTQSNRGPASARNLGVSRARGAYLAFLDSDDVWFPWTLELYARVLKETGNPVFLAGWPHRFRTEAPDDVLEGHEAHWTRFTDYLASGDRWRWFGVSSFVLARRQFLKIGGFRPEFRVGEDADLTMRLGIEPDFVQITAPVTFGYREHEDNMSRGPLPLLDAACKLVDAELAGIYPGGALRQRERRQILSRHTRPAAIASLQGGLVGRGVTLYVRTFIWQFAAGAWRFLLGFPLLAVLYAVKPVQGPKA